MSRVKRGVTSHARHKKVLKAAEGFYGRRKNTIRAAKAAVDKAGQYAYRDRRNKKRNFRALWIQRINAAVREHGLTYGRFIDGLLQGRDRGRPQGSVRYRHHRARSLRRAGRAVQDGARVSGRDRRRPPRRARQTAGSRLQPFLRPQAKPCAARYRDGAGLFVCPVIRWNTRCRPRRPTSPRLRTELTAAVAAAGDEAALEAVRVARAGQEGLGLGAARHARQHGAGGAQDRRRRDQRAEDRDRRR